MQSNRARTGELAKRGDAVGIAAEARDEPLDPEECVALVVETEVAGGFVIFFGFVEEVLRGVSRWASGHLGASSYSYLAGEEALPVETIARAVLATVAVEGLNFF
jgi:hypothetical protein